MYFWNIYYTDVDDVNSKIYEIIKDGSKYVLDNSEWMKKTFGGIDENSNVEEELTFKSGTDGLIDGEAFNGDKLVFGKHTFKYEADEMNIIRTFINEETGKPDKELGYYKLVPVEKKV